jgi:hypothetical protein
MRAVLVVGLCALFCPAVAIAQTAPAPPATTAPEAPATTAPRAASTKGGDITKEEYIEHAVERAKRAAAARFDRLDTNHDGVLTADERHAARAERAQKRAAKSQ